MNDSPLTLRWNGQAEPSQLLDREWLVTNGLGGYASGSLAGANTRKYHGLFVPNLTTPKGRHVLISRCDESVTIGDRVFHLNDVEFAGGRLHGEGHRWLREFTLDRGVASWIFDLGTTVLEKSVVMVHLHNTVCVRYRLLKGPAAELRVRPYVAFRRHDQSPEHPPAGIFTLTVQRGRHEMSLSDSPLVLRMTMQPGPPRFTTVEHEDLQLAYRIDRDRGEPALENVFSPGWFTAALRGSEPACFLASTQEWERLETDASGLFGAEQRRHDELLQRAGVADGDAFARQLVSAADQFIVLPGSRLEEAITQQTHGSDWRQEFRSVYAGYHWFGDWGRDTMISLEGLTLCTRRYGEAGAILRTFASYVKDGLLPNLFPEGERQALYHTVDATLWYFHAIARYAVVTKDDGIVRELFPILQSIVEHHIAGTHFGIHVDPADGLIAAGAKGYQLTWMDAKVGDWVVTPRCGKPVEIQALWYNALCLMQQWANEVGVSAETYRQRAEQARASFNARYWNEATRGLFDVIDGPDGDDAAIRPNQIFAISLPHPVLDSSRWSDALQTVHDQLLTPYGLRTLSPDHPDYKSRYRGNLLARDAAYHQGTVWPWLIGHYIDAWLRLRGDPQQARTLLMAFPEHLRDAGIGSISEIFDADLPHVPGGCMAQAWSVAEVLRAWCRIHEDARCGLRSRQ